MRRILLIHILLMSPFSLDAAAASTGVEECLRAGWAAADVGRDSDAASFFRMALAKQLALTGAENANVAMILTNLGAAYHNLGEFARAAEHHRRAASLFGRLDGETSPRVADALNELGLALTELGDGPAAVAAHARADSIRSTSFGRNSPQRAVSLSNLGAAYREMGDYPRALEAQRRALRIRRSALGETHALVAASYNNVATVYSAMDDSDRGLEAHLKSLAIRRANLSERHPALAVAYGNIGAVLRRLGRFEEALAYHDSSLAIRRAVYGDTHPEAAVSIFNRAAVHADRSEWDSAVEGFERALAIWWDRYGAKHPLVATAQYELGAARMKSGETGAAVAAFRRGVDAALVGAVAWDGTGAALRPAPVVVRLLCDLARAEAEDTSVPRAVALGSALATARAGLDVLERMRATLSQAGREIQEFRVRDLPGLVLRLQHELERVGAGFDPDLALRAAEMSASWSFLEMLALSRADLSGALESDLAAREREITAHLKRCDRRAGDPAADAERAAWERRWAEFQRDLDARAPRYATLRYPRPATLESIKTRLRPGEIALEYVLSEEGVFLVAISESVPRLFRLGALSDAAKEIAEVRSLIMGSSEIGLDKLKALSDRFFGPVVDLADEGPTTSVVLVPSGPVESLPFELLEDGARSASHDFHYFPSLASFALSRDFSSTGAASGENLLAVGNPRYAVSADAQASRSRARYSRDEASVWKPLPATKVEVAAIAEYFPETSSRVLLGRRASEEEVLRGDWDSFAFVHFACHGALEEGPGREPALVLTQDGNRNPEDGFLTLSEIAARRHRARLTVLSACNTGRSTAVTARRGVSNLARAFLLSGSDAVIVSLWPVSDDATARLMVELYRGIREEKLPVGEALRRARAKLRGNPATRHPRFWAPFICVGA